MQEARDLRGKGRVSTSDSVRRKDFDDVPLIELVHISNVSMHAPTFSDAIRVVSTEIQRVMTGRHSHTRYPNPADNDSPSIRHENSFRVHYMSSPSIHNRR